MSKDDDFERFYRAHYARVWRFFRTVYRLEDDIASDLAQEVFIRVYRSWEQYRHDAAWAFLEQIARRIYLNWLRSKNTIKRKVDMVPDFDAATMHVAVNDPDHAEVQQRELMRTRLRAAIAKLPSGQEQCVTLLLEGLTYKEIAERLGITIDAVKTRLKDARKRLKRELGEQVEWPDHLPEEDQ